MSATPPKPRKRNPGLSVLSRGEPIIWFTGTSLALCMFMIVGLICVIIYQGVVTFWPKPLSNYTSIGSNGDIESSIGESYGTESFLLKRDFYRSLTTGQRDYLRGNFLSITGDFDHLNNMTFLLTKSVDEILNESMLRQFKSTVPDENIQKNHFELSVWSSLAPEIRVMLAKHLKWNFKHKALSKKAFAELPESARTLVKVVTRDPGDRFDHLIVNPEALTGLDEQVTSELKPLLIQSSHDAIDALLPTDLAFDSERTLLRVGNFEINGARFKLIESFNIIATQNHDDAISIERSANGPFYGQIVGGGKLAQEDVSSDALPNTSKPRLIKNANNDFKISTGESTDGKAFESYHDSKSKAWSFYTSRIGDIQRLVNRKKHLEEDEKGHLLYLRDSAERKARSYASRFGKDSKRYQEAIAKVTEVHKETAPELAQIDDELKKINQEMALYGLVIKTSNQKLSWIPLSVIVRAYLPNEQTFGQKCATYISRWHEFLFAWPREANTEGGVWPAIVGTVLMTLLMTFAVVPFGVLAALYLREYAKSGPLISMVRIAVNNLAGVPSVVFGMFGLAFFCYNVGKYIDGGPENLGIETLTPSTWLLGFLILIILVSLAIFIAYKSTSQKSKAYASWLAPMLWIISGITLLVLLTKTPFFDGFFRESLIDHESTFGSSGVLWSSLTLALLTLPVVIVATEEALAAVPSSMREGSYACGASKWQTIQRIVLPKSMPGIMTGSILAMARGAGEVAPLMLVGAVKSVQNLPGGIDSEPPYIHIERSFMHLGFHIYDLGFQSTDSDASRPLVYTTTLLLLVLIAVLNLAAIWLRARLRKKFEGGKF